jgi:Reverse transcriptase (RNA-dependent DNA polymerase)
VVLFPKNVKCNFGDSDSIVMYICNKIGNFENYNYKSAINISYSLVYLSYIFNICFKLCYFPKSWKHANVISIPKPDKDHSNPSSYRSISLLSSIRKIFEWVILKRLNNFISLNNIWPNHQFGFRRAHSKMLKIH